MNARKDSGFTIIEVTLVLAITALMLIGILTGITLAVQRQRFSDSVHSTQSFLQQQFSYAQHTVNNRPKGGCDPANPGASIPSDISIRGASGCLVLGKLLEIRESAGADESTITSYDVIGEDIDTEAEIYQDYSDLELIRAVKPTVIEEANSSGKYIVPWGTHITSIRDDNEKSGTNQVIYVGLLRSPRSGVIYVYKINNTLDLADNYTLLSTNKDDPNISEVENESIKMCLESADLINHNAMLQITPTGSQDGVTSHFDDPLREAYGC